MLGFIEIIFSSIGIYGFFANNLICSIIGLIGIIICDCIDIFVSGHNPTTIWLAILLAIGASIANKNPLASFNLALCGENMLMCIFTIPFLFIGGISFIKEKKQNNNKCFYNKEAK